MYHKSKKELNKEIKLVKAKISAQEAILLKVQIKTIEKQIEDARVSKHITNELTRQKLIDHKENELLKTYADLRLKSKSYDQETYVNLLSELESLSEDQYDYFRQTVNSSINGNAFQIKHLENKLSEITKQEEADASLAKKIQQEEENKYVASEYRLKAEQEKESKEMDYQAKRLKKEIEYKEQQRKIELGKTLPKSNLTKKLETEKYQLQQDLYQQKEELDNLYGQQIAEDNQSDYWLVYRAIHCIFDGSNVRSHKNKIYNTNKDISTVNKHLNTEYIKAAEQYEATNALATVAGGFAGAAAGYLLSQVADTDAETSTKVGAVVGSFFGNTFSASMQSEANCAGDSDFDATEI
ncbi:MAG: hypothetical protein DGJ47_000258 [Rickettsiaceae bacterium]